MPPASIFDDIVVAVNFTHPHFDSIDFLIDLYRFPRVVFYGPPGSDDNRVTACDTAAGFFAYRIFLDLFRRHSARGYLLVHDDFLLNRDNFEGLDAAKVWSQPWRRDRVDRWFWWDKPVGVRALLSADPSLARHGISVPFGYSDLMYVPTEMAARLTRPLTDYSHHNVFVELAWPNIVSQVVSPDELQFLNTVDHVQYQYPGQSWQSLYSKQLHGIHPVKWSIAENRVAATHLLEHPPVVVGTAARASPRLCVVLVHSGTVADPDFERSLTELNGRGYAVRRVRQGVAPPRFRDRMVSEALAEGFEEILLLDPSVVFDPDDVERIRHGNQSMVCGIYPWPGRQGLACEFNAETSSIRFGRGGGRIPVRSCGLGFALVKRHVFEAVARQALPGSAVSYFTAPATGDPFTIHAAEDVAFCERVRAAGFVIHADTSVRLWKVGPTKLGWEDAGGDRERWDDFTLHTRSQAVRVASPPGSQRTESHRKRLREPVTPLRDGFPRIGLYVVTYPANAASLHPTLVSIRGSDWGEEPKVVMQPDDWLPSRESGSRNYRRALEAALASDCDFALVLEDDVRVNRSLRHNLLTNPLVQRDQCDYFGLFIPDLIADPWERCEPSLGYRLARPRYAGANSVWERNRVWGTQGLLLSRRLVKAALERWDRLPEGQDTRILSVCAEFDLPLWYAAPCLVEHAPLMSAFGTPEAYAPDFDAAFRLDVGTGFQPPEGVPGGLTLAEAELLWRMATGKNVLELGTRRGRSTVCVSQSARLVVCVCDADCREAREWVRRFGHSGKVEFVKDHSSGVCEMERFGLVVIDPLCDGRTVERDIASAAQVVERGGFIAFRNYPDPRWPSIRRIVDEQARQRGWKRRAQADFLGVFQCE